MSLKFCSLPYLLAFHCNAELKEIKATAIMMIKELPAASCSNSSSAFYVDATTFIQKSFQFIHLCLKSSSAFYMDATVFIATAYVSKQITIPFLE